MMLLMMDSKPKENTNMSLDLTSKIIAYEEGDLDFQQTVELFQDLIDNGTAWTLQGHYGRNAKELIRLGYCFEAGKGERV